MHRLIFGIGPDCQGSIVGCIDQLLALFWQEKEILRIRAKLSMPDRSTNENLPNSMINRSQLDKVCLFVQSTCKDRLRYSRERALLSFVMFGSTGDDSSEIGHYYY